MKQVVSFQKLLDGRYSLNTELEIFNWMLATGKKHREKGWPYPGRGVDQLLFNYSANCHTSYAPFVLGEGMTNFLTAAFTRAIVCTPSKPISQWRIEERINLSSKRIFCFNEGYPHRSSGESHYWNLLWEIHGLKKYLHKNLKKEFFHPDYTNRTDPQFISLKFSTGGSGYIIAFDFSFREYDYEPGWNKGFSQKPNESIDQFVYRAHKEIQKLLA